MSNVHLSFRAPGDLSVRYDPPSPGRPHEGAVSLAFPDAGLFTIFSSPEESERIARELLEKSERWRQDLGGDPTDTGRHAHVVVDGIDTTQLPVYRDPTYPDPQVLRAQAEAGMEERR